MRRSLTKVSQDDQFERLADQPRFVGPRPCTAMLDCRAMSNPRDRAAQRRASWMAQVVDAGRRKGLLYAGLSPTERLRALTALNARVWKAAGLAPKPLPRSQWPGEVFELPRRG